MPADAAHLLAAWATADPRAATVAERDMWQFNNCRWRRVVLHRSSCVELADGRIAFVRAICGGCAAGGGAFLVVERMVRMPCAGQFSDMHRIHHGVADWRAVGRALEQHNFTVVRNRATYAPDGTVDEITADRALVAVADVRALRLGVDFRRPVPPLHDRPQVAGLN